MPKMNFTDRFSPIRKGMLEFLLLKIIAARAVYVAEIIQQLRDTEFATPEGTLYPLLSRMRREGLVDYTWQESDAGPPRKYYLLTKLGQRCLTEANAYWQRINSTVDRLGRSDTTD